MLEQGARPIKEMTQPFVRHDGAKRAARRSSLPTTLRHFGVFIRASGSLGEVMAQLAPSISPLLPITHKLQRGAPSKAFEEILGKLQCYFG